MNNETVQNAQEYLTVISESRIRKIVDVKTLLERHPKHKVVSLLRDLSKQKQQVLMELIESDKTSSAINDTIVTMFRLHMAISTIENGYEVVKEVKAA